MAHSDRANVSRTFRIQKSIFEQLQLLANSKGVNINTLGNQVFRDYVEFHAHAGQAGLVPVYKELIVKLIEGKTPEEIEGLGSQIAALYMRNILSLLGYELEPSAFLQVLEVWIRTSAFPCTMRINDNIQSYYIQHDMGIRWSLFMRAWIKKGFEYAPNAIEIEVSDQSFSMKIDRSKIQKQE